MLLGSPHIPPLRTQCSQRRPASPVWSQSRAPRAPGRAAKTPAEQERGLWKADYEGLTSALETTPSPVRRPYKTSTSSPDLPLLLLLSPPLRDYDTPQSRHKTIINNGWRRRFRRRIRRTPHTITKPRMARSLQERQDHSDHYVRIAWWSAVRLQSGAV